MSNKKKYIAYCKKNINTTIFMQATWLDAVSDAWDVLCFEEAGKIFFLPIVLEKKLSYTLIRNPLLTAYSDIQSAHAITKTVVANFATQLQKYALVDLHLRNVNYLHWQSQNFETRNLHTNTILLTQNADLIYANFKDTCKRKIKKAHKNLVVSNTTDIKIIYALIEETFAKQKIKTPYKKSLIQQILNCCEANACGTVYTAIGASQKVVAMLWVIWDAQTMYYLISGISEMEASSGAINLLVWHALQEAQKKGCTIFDFEGSSIKSVDTFFKTFGTTENHFVGIQKYNSTILKTIMHIKNKL